MIKVYHHDLESMASEASLENLFLHLTCGLNLEQQQAAACTLWEHGGYTLVAEVDTDHLEKAFQLTNHISWSWLKNQEVSPKTEAARSTMVGDLMEDSDGNFWLTANFGFAAISLVPTSPAETVGMEPKT